MRMLEHSFEPEAGVRRVEVITGTGRRRRWSVDDKARIIAETLASGAVTSGGRAAPTGCRRSRFLAGDGKPSGALGSGASCALRLCASGVENACDTGCPPAGR